MKKTEPAVGPVVETSLRVRYAETDQMGVVYYANYYIWMEVGRTAYCRECGFSYRDLEAEYKAYLIVAESRCRYKMPARYDDQIIVRTRLTTLHRRAVRFAYEIIRADGALLAEGETMHVLVDQNQRPLSFPPQYLEMLRHAAAEREF